MENNSLENKWTKLGKHKMILQIRQKKDLDKKSHTTFITAATVSVAEQQIPKN
jgi:hypothetical protein